MDYKQKYEKALRVATQWHKDGIGDVRTIVECIFPELKESEDERIRKVLIGWINLEPSISFNDTFDGFSKEQILAWLEKQGEQKTADKEEELTEFERAIAAYIMPQLAMYAEEQIIQIKSMAKTIMELAMKESQEQNLLEKAMED